MAGLVPGLVPAIHVVQFPRRKRFATPPWRSTKSSNLLKYLRPSDVDRRDKPGDDAYGVAQGGQRRILSARWMVAMLARSMLLSGTAA
jgi:hypothetical protein